QFENSSNQAMTCSSLACAATRFSPTRTPIGRSIAGSGGGDSWTSTFFCPDEVLRQAHVTVKVLNRVVCSPDTLDTSRDAWIRSLREGDFLPMRRDREDILTAAGRYFSRNGFRTTSMQEMAEALDVSRSSLYYHFTEKSDLLYELLVRLTDEFAERAREIVRY